MGGAGTRHRTLCAHGPVMDAMLFRRRYAGHAEADGQQSLLAAAMVCNPWSD